MSTQLIGLTEAARMLGVSVYTIRRLVAHGDVAAVNIGARRLVPTSEIERVVQRGAGQPRPANVNRKAR